MTIKSVLKYFIYMSWIIIMYIQSKKSSSCTSSDAPMQLYFLDLYAD